MQNKSKKYIVAAFQDCELGDALADLASITEYLCETEECSVHHHGLYLIHKILTDNLEMLSRRARPKTSVYPDEEMMMND